MLRRWFTAAALAVALGLVAAPASPATVLTFEGVGLGDNDPITNQFPDFSFVDAMALIAGSSLNEIEFPPKSADTVMSGLANTVRINFLTPISAFGAFVTYIDGFSLEAYNSSNALLGAATSAFGSNLLVSGDSGSSPNEFLEVSFANMAYVVFRAGPGGFLTADDLTYTAGVRVPAPEPGVLGLMLSGGVAILTARRRRRA